MRQLLVAAFAIVAVSTLQAETPQDKTAQVKGLHLCCKQCAKSVQAILDKVDGVSEVKCDIKNKTVTFAAKDAKAAGKAVDALYAGGFAGTGTFGDSAVKRESTGADFKANEVTVKGVHACCGQCVGALKALFKDATVTVVGKGTQKAVNIAGKDLNATQVLQTLQSAGFNGKVERLNPAPK